MAEEKSGRVYAIVEKALVPLILGLLVFTNQQAQVSISRAQTKLAEEQAKMAVVQSEQGFNLECVKQFYAELCGNDPVRKKMAITLLAVLNDSLAKPLAEVASMLAGDSATAAAADSLRGRIVARELSKNRIEILYLVGEEGCARIAAEMRDSINGRALAETVIVRGVPEESFRRQNPNGDNAIRYQARAGSDAVQRLQSVLASLMPDREFRLVSDEGHRMFRSIRVFLSPPETPRPAPDTAQPGPSEISPTDSETPSASPRMPGGIRPGGGKKEGA
jgi:hypothetical protein